jgi:tRNA threonylcarbamoyl adenosine modification protein YeaZ
MLVLSIEMSSAENDVALLRDGAVTARRTWAALMFHHTRLFALLREVLAEAGVTPEQIELFAVGRGPGSFSGTRIALTAAQAFAMPGGRPVVAVSSGTALARTVAAAGGAAPIAVIGDARRDTIWLGVFDGKTGTPAQPAPWITLPLAQLAAVLPAGTQIVSPDWTRLAPHWPAQLPQPIAQYPTAAAVAQLALEQHAGRAAPEPLLPIYLHPAVATPPARAAAAPHA